MKRMILAAALCLASLTHAATITDVRVSSAGPITFGQVFAAGDVKKSDVLIGSLGGVAVPLQVDTKATHADGSVRHATISAQVPKAGTMQINTGGIEAASTPSTNAAIPASVSATIAGVKYSATSPTTTGEAMTWLNILLAWINRPSPWTESACGQYRTHTDGRKQVWDDSQMDEWHGGDWMDVEPEKSK